MEIFENLSFLIDLIESKRKFRDKRGKMVETDVWPCVGRPSPRLLLLFFFKRNLVLSKSL